MSRDFTKNLSNYMSLGTNAIGPLLGSVGGISVSFVINRDTVGSLDDVMNFNNGDTASLLLWRMTSQAYVARVVADAYIAGGLGTNATTGSWVYHGISVDWSANPYLLTRYVDGSSASTASPAKTGGNYVHTTSSYIDIIGASTSGATLQTTRQIDGKIAEFAVWNKTLTAGDFLALGKGACPLKVQPQAIIAYWKLNGQGTSADVELFNRLGTITGSLPVSDHPRIF